MSQDPVLKDFSPRVKHYKDPETKHKDFLKKTKDETKFCEETISAIKKSEIGKQDLLMLLNYRTINLIANLREYHVEYPIHNARFYQSKISFADTAASKLISILYDALNQKQSGKSQEINLTEAINQVHHLQEYFEYISKKLKAKENLPANIMEPHQPEHHENLAKQLDSMIMLLKASKNFLNRLPESSHAKCFTMDFNYSSPRRGY